MEERGGEIEPPGYSRSKKRTLEDLFKPPLDIMYQVGQIANLKCLG